MSTNPVYQSATDNTKPAPAPFGDYVDDPTLPPQRHAGMAGLGPNYPVGPSLGDKLRGFAEELKGKTLGEPELVERGRERRTGEMMRKERKRDSGEAAEPFKEANGGVAPGAWGSA